jgi:hypothetical protein
MVGKRIAALGAVLLLTSACSRLPIGPTAYSSLPAATVASIPAQPVVLPAVSAEMSTARPSVAIPGTLKMPAAESGSRGVNPTAVLEASKRARMAWAPLHPADLLKPPALAARSVGADVAETGATSVTRDPRIGKAASAGAVALTYDREATMDRLVKGGRDAAKAICSGC